MPDVVNPGAAVGLLVCAGAPVCGGAAVPGKGVLVGAPGAGVPHRLQYFRQNLWASAWIRQMGWAVSFIWWKK